MAEITCPDWCTQEDCRGEHFAISSGSYIPASGGYFARTESMDAAVVPRVSVGLSWAEHWGGGQCLDIVVYGEGDTSVTFKPNEALAFATEVVIMLEAMVQASDISIEDGERVLELAMVSASLRDMLVKPVKS